MSKKYYVVKRAGTYGKVGKVIERDFGEKGLTDRQGVLIEEYEKPVIKVDNSEEIKTLQAETKELQAKLQESEAKLQESEAKLAIASAPTKEVKPKADK